MRRLAALIAATVVGVSPMVLANPVAAAPSPSSTHLQCNNTFWTFDGQAGPGFTGAPGDQLAISNPNTSGAGTVTWSLPAGYSLVSGSLTLPDDGSSAVISYGSSDGTLTVSAAIACGAGGTSASVNVAVTAGGGDSSPTAAGPAPALETLTLEVSTGNTTCTGGSPTGYTGAWLQLPAADACSQSGPDANPNAKLLGWATDPLFPVSVAQEIVDLKYGPIDDYFYGMRMIFIPAGGWTFVSSSNNLYPIWSS